MQNWQVVIVTLVGVAVVFGGIGFVVAGSLGRLFRSRAIARRWLSDAAFAEKVDALLVPPKPVPPPKPSAEPLWLLAVLQREGRLLDFLLEDIQAYADDQNNLVTAPAYMHDAPVHAVFDGIGDMVEQVLDRAGSPVRAR